MGAEVGWTPIALAQGLTNLGLAAREASGWRITAAGEAMLASNADEPSYTILRFRPRANRSEP